ncbi:molybdate ABC transporter substrate-binding protein [Salmonella enterica]|uniref:Molybdate ABC transporter substrate-binding protein n=6 Tax=Salmonella enterica TaxID=28901 RepID=A0A3Z7QMD0_SALET|nr:MULTISPECIES: molybdate ABC transporter substrate-binding protein [Salmonella]EAA9665965.1 molybdate ABC transporter substrate-binding protein [Salmonella enterica subsp. enterica serovar Infantis]EAV9420015.1 molybdate ABC transporter substrate-binding protein [Salmonella enterica subsp. enterica serovar Typhisuis]EBA0168812.1 molybdate ABC transporter substrate-binding protein [Salmonella enterica subsp. enterica serovar Enteritidis]EBX2443327.1 molybdenum ABC transporter substrate-binding
MRILAAGSLRVVWPQLMTAFQADAVCDFGPAGLLRERIEACDFFASANLAHPQALLESGRALRVAPFTTNRLCLSVRAQAMREGEDWLSLLTRRDLRIGTSTAGCDPSGDYTQQLFSRMGNEGEAVRKRAVALVGGRQTLPLPAGRLAAEWLINHDYTDIFIGYASYAPRLRQVNSLRVIDIPEPYNPVAEYGFACLSEQGKTLADFLLSARARLILMQHGFSEAPNMTHSQN